MPEPFHKPVVLTSLNPHRDFGHQSKCFSHWKALGFDARSFNVDREAGLLTGLGIDDADIVQIEDRHTSREDNGKPLPRILHLLRYARDRCPARHVILTNSDIFPALRSNRITRWWERAFAPCLAMTREECYETEARSFHASRPYRGGLDVFFFNHRALRAVLDVLSELESPARMTFGVPGWDYLLAAGIIDRRAGGRIMDGKVFMHRLHPATYRDTGALTEFLPDMEKLGVIRAGTAVDAAREFAATIDTECRRHETDAQRCKLAYFAPAEVGNRTGPCRYLDATLVRLVDDCIPGVLDGHPPRNLDALARRLRADDTPFMELAYTLFVTSSSVLFQFAQTLAATLFALKCRSPSRRYDASTHYTAPGAHHATLRHLLEIDRIGDPTRRRNIAQLFGTELVEHGVFNTTLFEYLLRASENEYEIRTLEAIRRSVRLVSHAA